MKRITLKVFNTAIEAHILRSKLDSEGIQCYILDENIVTLNPMLNFAVGGIRLQVAEEDFDAAKAILNEMDEKPYTDEKDNAIACPNCESTELYSDYKSTKNSKSVIALLTAFIFAVFPLYTKSVFKCKDCGTEFDRKKEGRS